MENVENQDIQLKDLVKLTEDSVEKQNERFSVLEQRIDDLTAQRKVTGTATESKDEDGAAFSKYLRSGEILDKKYLAEGTANVGGYLVPTDVYFDIHNKIVSYSPIRDYATVVQTSTNKVEMPVEASQFAAAWTTETGQRTDSTGETFGQVGVDLHEMYVRIPVSNALLEDSAVNIEAWLVERAARQFAKLEGTGFVNGSGSGQPLGFTHVSNGFGVYRGANKTTFGAADFINVFYDLPVEYQDNAVWVMNSATVAAIRNLKDAGAYVWQPALSAGTPQTLLGRPIVVSPDMPAPNAANGSPIAVLADLRAGYVIADRIGMEVTRDPYTRADYGQTVFRFRRRVGGTPLMTEAGRYLKQDNS